MLVPISRLGSKYDASRALELLDFVGLTDLKNEYAKNLSYGQQKLVEFARALMLTPKLFLLDEPVAGISPGMRGKKLREIFRALPISFISSTSTILFIRMKGAYLSAHQ